MPLRFSAEKSLLRRQSGHTFDDKLIFGDILPGLVVNKGENPHKLIIGVIILVLS